MTLSEGGNLHQSRRVPWAAALIPPAVTVALLGAWLAYRQQDFDRLAAEVRTATIDIRNLPVLEKRLAVARQSAIALSPASSDLSADADLLEEARAATSAIGMQPENLELLPAVDLGAYHRLGVSLRAVIDSDRLIAFLRLIEESRPTLWIDALNVTSTSASASSMPANLQVSMSIFMLRCNVGECRGR